ncbi:MAG: GNAT family protein [Bacilli bacterium]|jgi:RimJ/RimL family protein N-acetyltransferase
MIIYKQKPVGEMNYRCHDLKAEIGIKICEAEYQNQGIGRNALKGLISYLFDELKMKTVVLDTNLKNKRAQHVYESIGFLSTGIRYQAFKKSIGC